jgi:hypothetical protein
MAYKKYIKRGGKIYGPYIYHSKRVGGKVVSEYRGQDKLKIKNFKFLWVILGIFVLLGIFYFLSGNFERGMTGHAVLELNENYLPGENLEGQLKILLNEGELVPQDSEIFFENNGVVYSYPLIDLVSEEFIEGNYFISNSSVSGFGPGYGLQGEKEIYPELSFILLISDREVSGKVSKDNDFIYSFKENETVELKPESVQTESGKQVSNEEIILNIENKTVYVTTEYFEIEQGFGENYFGEETKEIVIDVSELGLVLDEGNLNVGLNYGDKKILVLEKSLESDESSDFTSQVPAMQDVEEEQIPSESEETNKVSNETETISFDKLNLTTSERQILESEFGVLNLEVEEAVFKNGFLVVRYKLSDYWIEFTYDAALSQETLNRLMEQDRIKWLKDLAKTLQEVPTPEETVEVLEGQSFGV